MSQPPPEVHLRRLDELKPWEKNYNVGDVPAIRRSIARFGMNGALRVWRDGIVIAGNHALLALREMRAVGELPPEHVTLDQDGEWLVPTISVTHLDKIEAEAFAIADNRTRDLASQNDDALAALLQVIAEESPDAFSATGYDETELQRLLGLLDPGGHGEDGTSEPNRTLAERFLVPPFTVLDARLGYWQERKSAWLALGIDSAASREGMVVTGSPSGTDPTYYRQKRDAEAHVGRDLTAAEFEAEHYQPPGGRIRLTDTGGLLSQFDPVLAELAFRWFSPPGGRILDPFAGGSVRGAVAGRLGRTYVGIDLRDEQVEANRCQGEALELGEAVTWIVGDSRDILDLATGTFDFVFSCPPYADYERYSDDPRDLSTLDYPGFLDAYRTIIDRSCRLLADDRFACFVVGDIRDGRGLYRNFVAHTIDAFHAAGLALYNEAVLVTMAGSVPIRTGRQFAATRKLGKTHQNVLVFVKGDPRRATEACGPVEVADVEEMFGEVLPDDA